MPVIVPPEAFDLWLDCRNVDAMTAAAIFLPAPEGLLEAYEISPAVNRTANDGPGLIEPVSAATGSAPAETAPPAAPSATAEARSTRRRVKRDDGQFSLF